MSFPAMAAIEYLRCLVIVLMFYAIKKFLDRGSLRMFDEFISKTKGFFTVYNVSWERSTSKYPSIFLDTYKKR